MAVDPHFGVDHYGRPKMLTESQTIVYNIMTILLGRPGYYPSIPNMGMHVQQYLYNFVDEIDGEAIKQLLIQQCREFSPYVTDGSFDVIVATHDNPLKKEKTPLLIFKLPVILTGRDSELILGVTINEEGYFAFNYEFTRQQVI